MEIPEDLKYTTTHEWVRLEGNIARVGITDFAQESLGDIVYVELPETGEQIEKEAEVGTVESVKAASSIYSPLSGAIAESNGDLEASPEQALFPARSGTEFELQIVFTAPVEPGLYRSAWQAVNPAGNVFGDLFFVEIMVENPTPSPEPP